MGIHVRRGHVHGHLIGEILPARVLVECAQGRSVGPSRKVFLLLVQLGALQGQLIGEIVLKDKIIVQQVQRMLHVHQLVQSLGQDYLLVETDVHLQAHGVVDHLKSALGLVDGSFQSGDLYQNLVCVHLLGHSRVHRLLGQLVQLAHGTEVAPEQCSATSCCD